MLRRKERTKICISRRTSLRELGCRLPGDIKAMHDLNFQELHAFVVSGFASVLFSLHRLVSPPATGNANANAAGSNLTLNKQGLMFSAGSDLSIVTWYPPREDDDGGATAAALPHPSQAAARATAASPLTPLEDPQEDRQRHHSGSTDEPSPVHFPPPSPAAAPVPAAEDGDDYDDDNVQARVTHETDPGVVVHVAEVVGMAAVPGGLVSADLVGRLLERGPERLVGE